MMSKHDARTGNGTVVSKLFKKLLMSEYFALILSVVYFLVIAAFVPSMFSARNMRNIFSNMWPLFTIAVGQTFVLLLGGIDISQSAIMSVTSVIGAVFVCRSANPDTLGTSPLWGWFLTENGGPFANVPDVPATLIAILIMVFVGTLIGFINGNLIARLNMPPFMVTLISKMFFEALAILITKSRNVMCLPTSFEDLGYEAVGFLPWSFFFAIVLAIVAHFLLTYTIRGRHIYSVGVNPKAAKVSGISTVKTNIFVYSFSGFCAALGAVLYSARMMQGRPSLGSNMFNDIMAATVIGGTSMYGGKGKITWTLFGVLFYTILSTSLQQLKLDNFTIDIVKGVVILLAATLDAVRSRMQREIIVSVDENKGKKVTEA